MSNNLEEMPIEDLRELLQASLQTLAALVDSLADRPDMQNAIRRLMRPDDMIETFSVGGERTRQNMAVVSGRRGCVGERAEFGSSGC